MFDVIKNKYIFLGFSVILVAASVISLIAFGLKPGIDFTGGTLWQIKPAGEVSEADVSSALVALGIERPTVYREISSESMVIKTGPLSEDEHQRLRSGLSERIGTFEESRFESVGPTIGKQLRGKSIWAAILVLLVISIYIAISFRKVSYPVASWKYGLTTLITLFHDVLIPTGILAVLGKFRGVEIDTNFVVALLVIVGFSVHDTIVVFDRVRENVLARRSGISFAETVNASIWQTMARSINTSLTLVLMLVAMLVLGSSTLQLFVVILLVGTVIGTYSSIFVASPLLTIWHKQSTMGSQKK